MSILPIQRVLMPLIVVGAVFVAGALLPRTAIGDSNGILVQALDGRLVTGAVSDDLNTTQIPIRTFASQFPDTFAWNDPGFHSLGSPPTGVDVLPVGSALEWDFVPMRDGGLTSNLMYWDGQGQTPADVQFGPLPDPDISLTLFGRNNEAAAADGSDQLVPGKTIDIVNAGAGLRMHAHRFFFLDDNDGDLSTTPDEGVYLASMQLRMDGFETSEPFYLVWGTLGVPLSAIEQAAVPWVQQREHLLTGGAGDFNADGLWDCQDANALVVAIANQSPSMIYDLNGDGQVNLSDLTGESDGWLSLAGSNNIAITGGAPYLVGDANLDGTVDGQDFVAWNSHKFLASAGWCDGDFNASGFVDGQDFVLWNNNKFQSSAGALSQVPEPAAYRITPLILAMLACIRRINRTSRAIQRERH